MSRIAIYLGDSVPPNLVRLLEGICKLAADRFDFEVVGSDLDASQLPARFSYYDVPDQSTARGLSRLLATRRRLGTYLQSADPDAIWQITAPQFHALPVLLAAHRHGVPVATRLPGNKFDEFREQSGLDSLKTYVLNNVFLRALRYSTLVVVLDEYNREAITSRGVSDEIVHTLPQPIDTDEFAPVDTAQREALQHELGFDRDAHCLLYVGRLSELKGMDDLERVVAHYEGTAEYEFHLVGTGPFASTFEQYENTVVHGYVDPDEIHRYYKAADVHVHPSRIEVGGICWTMIEAAATGLPVIARDIGNAADLASFVFTDPEEIVTYLSDPAAWEQATYPDRWALETLSPKYNTFFDALVAGVTDQ